MKKQKIAPISYLVDKHSIQILLWYTKQVQERLQQILKLQEEERKRLRYHRGIMDLRDELDRCTREYSYFLQENDMLVEDFERYIQQHEFVKGDVNDGQGVSGKRTGDLDSNRNRPKRRKRRRS